VLSWPVPDSVEVLRGGMLLRDGARAPNAALALTRAILHTNPQIVQSDALFLAVVTDLAAERHDLSTEFLGATLLQESAYDPRALSAAGAIGIAQFEPETASDEGIDPTDPIASIEGAADLLGGYVAQYRAAGNGDPYALALAAYNAGPGAVARYHGVPPYPETRDYIALIEDRWARIASYERRMESKRTR
jgi:soluble lytic murein transglycosylase-like protein